MEISLFQFRNSSFRLELFLKDSKFFFALAYPPIRMGLGTFFIQFIYKKYIIEELSKTSYLERNSSKLVF